MKTFATLAATAAILYSSLSFASPININTATAADIASALNGVGISRAEAIVAYRNANGVFTSPEQIKQVSGIGNSTFEKNKADIIVE